MNRVYDCIKIQNTGCIFLYLIIILIKKVKVIIFKRLKWALGKKM